MYSGKIALPPGGGGLKQVKIHNSVCTPAKLRCRGGSLHTLFLADDQVVITNIISIQYVAEYMLRKFVNTYEKRDF
jgi:hypothetical protein